MTTATKKEDAPNTQSNDIRILIGDKLAQEGLDYLNSFDGVQVDIKTGLSEEELIKTVVDYDGMVIRSGVKMTPATLENPGRLKAIARAGVGVDNIDLTAATKSGIMVMNSAEASTITTAEHAFALLMSLARNIGPAYKTMSEGGWDRNKYVGTQLAGKTIGIVGFGRIGQTVAKFALGLDMNVIAFDPVFNAETAFDGKVKLYKSFDEMVPLLDAISFHVPLNEHTRSMLNKDRFAKAKPGLLVINAARGGVVDIPDLLEALDAGQCAGAAIDVYESEPPAEDDPLRTHPKVLCTPHLGASTSEAQTAVSTHACMQLLEFLKGEGLRGAVNAPGVRLDLDPTQLKYLDLSKRMASLLGLMCEDGISDITVTLQGKTIAGAANTIERMTLVELLNQQLNDPVNLVNATLIAEQRNIKIRCVIEEEPRANCRLIIEVKSGDKTRRIVGSIYADGLPRVLEVNGYHMDMVPAGHMMLVQNNDQPGMIALVSKTLGDAGINIADMAISRRGDTALMVLKIDTATTKEQIDSLRSQDGILKVAGLDLEDAPNPEA